jgi:SAM-dependent methyltransferase
MHDSVYAWVGRQVGEHDLVGLRTLEVGSLDVNGSVRALFSGTYIGLDMREGPGVDIVGTAAALPFPDASFDCIVSTEMLEHDPSPWNSMAEMGRVLRPGGRLIITTRGNGFGEHLEPSDYWRFMPNVGPVLLDLASCDGTTELDPEVPGIFLSGVRR